MVLNPQRILFLCFNRFVYGSETVQYRARCSKITDQKNLLTTTTITVLSCTSHTTVQKCFNYILIIRFSTARLFSELLISTRGYEIQGGSNMTGTNCDLFTHNQSRSYLNHLVFSYYFSIGNRFLSSHSVFSGDGIFLSKHVGIVF